MNIAIILNYNDYETTYTALERLRVDDAVDKIVVVDNCSTDDSYVQLYKHRSNKVDVIKTKENRGYAYGNNFGVKYAEHNYLPTNIIISNPDVITGNSLVKNVCNYLDSHNRVAAATAVTLDNRGCIVDEFAWKLPKYSDLIRETFLLLDKFLKLFNRSVLYSKEALTKNSYMVVDVLPGCFFVIKHKVMKEVGYFDERTFLYCEENILAQKLKDKGYESHLLTHEKLVHYHSVSINKSIKSWKTKSKIFENSHLVYLEHYLRVSKCKIWLYKVLFNIGKYEKYILQSVKRLIFYGITSAHAILTR